MKNFKNFLKILNPQPKIGALEISDVDLKFSLIKDDEFISYSAKLAAGVIKDGKISDRERFLSALSVMHSQITAKMKEKINVIVNISDNNVYFQVFNLPMLESNLKEAVNLNLKMISPIDFSKAYSDWQAIGEEVINDSDQLEIFGAFSESQMIDEFDKSLREANFMPVAFEFSGLALARLAVDFGANVNKNKPFLLFYIGANGLSFNLIRNGNLYFNHFVSWQIINLEAKEIPMDLFKKLIIDDVKKVLSFYNTRWKEQIDEMILVTHGLNDAIVKIMSENFSFNKVEPLSLKKIGDVAPENIQPAWFSVLGSAIRGIIPRSKDNMISLAKIGTEEEFFQHRILDFIKIWRNAVIITLAVILIVFIGVNYLIFDKAITSLNDQISGLGQYKQSEKGEFEKIRKNIEIFNQKIDFAVKVSVERSMWASFFEKISNLAAGDNISIRRIYVQSIDMPLLFNALGSSEDAAIDFKNKLIAEGFHNVDLPITKISRTDKGVEFTVSFGFKD